MKLSSKSIRLIVLALLFSLSFLLQACNFHDDVITPWQEQKNIPTNCSVIC